MSDENGNGHSNKLMLDLDYQVKGDSQKGAALSAVYINFAVNSCHPKGLEGQMRRIYGRIQRKLDEAVERNQDSIELEQAEKDFLRKTFEKAVVPANDSKYFVVLEDEIERATARK